MDDHHRLIRLLSFIAYTNPQDNRCGLRISADSHHHADLPGPQLFGVIQRYSGAVDKYLKGEHVDTSADIDIRELPAWTLNAVSDLDDHQLATLGSIINSELPLLYVTPMAAARWWADDVIATAWRLMVETHTDHFGDH